MSHGWKEGRWKELDKERQKQSRKRSTDREKEQKDKAERRNKTYEGK
jgi:hypothetical protein